MDYRRLKTPNKRKSRKHTKVIVLQTAYKFNNTSITHVIGVDECGWGAIAGSLAVGGCLVPVIDGLQWLAIKDSKRYTTERARDEAYTEVQRHAAENRLYFHVCLETPLQVSSDPAGSLLRCQHQVVQELLLASGLNAGRVGVLVDGKTPIRGLASECVAVPKADSLFKVVSAASVVAKVVRDRLMTASSDQFPEYNFFKNKGYPTQQHRQVLHQVGPCSLHRTNIACVQSAARRHKCQVDTVLTV